MRLGSIYTLRDPITGLVRYVGSTIVKPKRRYDQHIYQWKRCEGNLTHKDSWIKHLALKELKPILNIEDEGIPENKLDKEERRYIFLYKSIGASLCNHTIGRGGISGYKHTEESKNKRLKSLSTSKAWAEKHIRHSKIMKANYKGPVVKKHSEATKLKMSIQAKKEYKNNPKARKGLEKHVAKVSKGVYVGKTYFNSILKAAKFIGVVSNTVKYHCKNNTLCKGYKVKFENKNQYTTGAKGNSSKAK